MKLNLGWVLFCGIFFMGNALAAKQIALTFDDAPRPDSQLTGAQRTDRLLSALEQAGVEQVMFFVTTKHLNDDNQTILDQYQTAGHVIGNHSDQHQWLHKTDLAVYQADLLTAHQRLKDLKNFKPFFRFPYLDEGRDEQKHQGILQFLKDHDYQNGYVTVDNYDWYLDSLYQQASKAGKPIDMDQLKQLYIDVLWEAIRFSDQIAMQYLGRSPKHVLLLHDNDLAAYFIDDLVAHIKTQGWEIISPSEAYTDPIAAQVPKTLFNGQGRVAALAHAAGAKPRDLVHVAEDEAQLAQLFKDYQVVKQPSAAMPAWLQAEMQSQVGTWKTSNAKYQGENEPFSHYVIEWTWAIGQQGINGRLFALNDGQPTGDFWHFKQYWDPVQHQARLIQWGHGGRVGDGVMEPDEQGQMVTIQTFAAPNLNAYQEKHLSHLTDAGLVTTSYNLNEGGDWQQQRTYLWLREDK